MEWQEVVGIFHAKRVILRSSVYSLIIAREKSGKRDSRSQSQKSQINKKTPPGLMSVWTVPVDSARRGVWLLVEGGVNLYFYRLGTATNVFSMEDSDSWWSQSEQEKCIPQNFIYLCFKNLSSGTSANPCFPLRRDFLFYFYAESPPSLTSTRPESNIVIPMHYDNWCCMLAWLDLLYHEL